MTVLVILPIATQSHDGGVRRGGPLRPPNPGAPAYRQAGAEGLLYEISDRQIKTSMHTPSPAQNISLPFSPLPSSPPPGYADHPA
jgi:hypothetical protein